MIAFLRWLLLPLSILYATSVWIRNKLYDWRILSSTSYPVKTIVVGNLAIGGSGKSPMTEHLISIFHKEHRLAVLSRGYGRDSRGFVEVSPKSDVSQVGDEPLQFKKKFPWITVVVCEDRRIGIETLMRDHDLIILDDAFQHRRILGQVNILLFEYNSILNPVLPLPTGNFRDLMNQTVRAEIVVITKCPNHIPKSDRDIIEQKIFKYGKKPVFYSFIDYGKPTGLDGRSVLSELEQYHVLLVTGIANPIPLRQYLLKQTAGVISVEFADHHPFSEADYRRITQRFEQINSPKKIILTTTKDLQRLDAKKLQDIPLYYLPISIGFDDEDAFEVKVREALTR